MNDKYAHHLASLTISDLSKRVFVHCVGINDYQPPEKRCVTQWFVLIMINNALIFLETKLIKYSSIPSDASVRLDQYWIIKKYCGHACVWFTTCLIFNFIFNSFVECIWIWWIKLLDRLNSSHSANENCIAYSFQSIDSIRICLREELSL